MRQKYFYDKSTKYFYDIFRWKCQIDRGMNPVKYFNEVKKQAIFMTFSDRNVKVTWI